MKKQLIFEPYEKVGDLVSLCVIDSTGITSEHCYKELEENRNVLWAEFELMQCDCGGSSMILVDRNVHACAIGGFPHIGGVSITKK